jgi:hypothetical protein
MEEQLATLPDVLFAKAIPLRWLVFVLREHHEEGDRIDYLLGHSFFMRYLLRNRLTSDRVLNSRINTTAQVLRAPAMRSRMNLALSEPGVLAHSRSTIVPKSVTVGVLSRIRDRTRA